MRRPQAIIAQSRPIGRWNVFVRGAYHGAARMKEITWLRSAPISVDDMSWTDPFGPESATLTFPQISVLEPHGGNSEDLWWLRRGTEVDIVFTVTEPETVAMLESIGMEDRLVWEGKILSFGYSSAGEGDSVSANCVGAMRVLDSRMAPKVTFSRPYPYEWVIWRHFDYAAEQHPTGVSQVHVEWPDWWNTYYKYNVNLPWYLQPAGINDGDMWSAMLVREFGRWDPVLSSAIQGLLSVMFTDRGQFTLMLDNGRVPVLRHRDRLSAPGPRTMELDAAWPGVALNLASDGSQRVDTVYGESRSSISGTVYRGTRYSIDGSQAGFDPFAIHHSVNSSSGMTDPFATRNELFINFADGLSPSDSRSKAHRHVETNAHPGYTGTIGLSNVDPRLRHPSGEMVAYPGVMVKAGDTVLLRGFLGRSEGMLFHVSKAQISMADGSVQLTVDSKFRDFMTVREVMDRGRDALRPWHMMTVGKYNFNIPDAMLPWDYAQGSGYIPYRVGVVDFWSGMPAGMNFPWTELTTSRPPGHATWSQFYIKVPAIVRDEEGGSWARSNWNRPSASSVKDGCYVLLAQAGEIALLQVCAYNADGTVKKVPFHLSIWESNNVDATMVPVMRDETPGVVSGIYTAYFTDHTSIAGSNPPEYTKQAKYRVSGFATPEDIVAQPYPFYQSAWENIRSDGSQNNDLGAIPTDSAGLLVGYGNNWEKAGYWPHTGRAEVDDFAYPSATKAELAKPTGMLVDEQGFSFDMSRHKAFDPTSRSNTLLEHANATVMVYCESETDTYFLGRLYRKEYGAS